MILSINHGYNPEPGPIFHAFFVRMKDKPLKIDMNISGQIGAGDFEVMSLAEFVQLVASTFEGSGGFKHSQMISHVGVIDKDATIGILERFVWVQRQVDSTGLGFWSEP